MAAGSAGALNNVELGFAPTNSSVVTLAGTTAGWLEGDINFEVPREYAFVKGSLTKIKHTATAKDATLTFSAREILQEHLQYAYDGDAAATGVLTIDDDMGSTIAVTVKTFAPSASTASSTPDAETRVISIPKALNTGSGSYSIPKATTGDTNQVLSFEFIALGDTASTELLATVTDDYT